MDAEPLAATAGASFAPLQQTLSAGLSRIYIGGLPPGAASPVPRSWEGEVDNVRVWWPPCPTIDDPSRYDPVPYLGCRTA